MNETFVLWMMVILCMAVRDLSLSIQEISCCGTQDLSTVDELEMEVIKENWLEPLYVSVWDPETEPIKRFWTREEKL